MSTPTDAEIKSRAVDLEQCALFVDSKPIARAMTDGAATLRALLRDRQHRADVPDAAAELEIRKRQVGLLANCLSHIQGSSIAPEQIRIAATAAIVGASELTKEIAAPPPPAPALEPRHDG
jgi:hypothetical protein